MKHGSIGSKGQRRTMEEHCAIACPIEFAVFRKNSIGAFDNTNGSSRI
jgi:hypothetical protein